MKKVDMIFCADLHLRDTTPLCRTDDYWKAMTRKLQFIRQQQEKYKCTVIIAGDLFEKAKSSPRVEAHAIKEFPKEVLAIPGQHDSPSHRLALFKESSMSVLEAAGKVVPMLSPDAVFWTPFVAVRGFPFGTTFKDVPKKIREDNVRCMAVVHDMIHKTKSIHKSMTSTKAISMLKNSSYDVIVTGDNHQPFVETYKGRILVNCGSMMRSSANQADYKPCLWLYNAESNTVEPAYYPIESDVIDRTHIETKEIKEARMERFIDRIDSGYKIGLSYTDNLRSYFKKNKTRKGIIDKIYQAVGRKK